MEGQKSLRFHKKILKSSSEDEQSLMCFIAVVVLSIVSAQKCLVDWCVWLHALVRLHSLYPPKSPNLFLKKANVAIKLQC